MRNLSLLCLAIALCAGLLLATGAPAQDQGPVTIGGVTYERVDPGEPFVEGMKQEQDWTPPAPTAAETAAGLIPFTAADPGEFRPGRLPKPSERLEKLQVFLTPGEDEPLTFAVRSLTALQGLTVTAEAGGAPVTIDVRHEHCWPQRTGWRSRQWYVTPELLLPCANGKKTVPVSRGVLQEVAFDVPAETTQGFWLTLTAPAAARAGRYEGTVTIAAAGKQALRLPLQIEVLPFTLQRPAERSWLLYADAGRWNGMSDQQILAELRDYSRHGMNGLIEIGLGSPDLSRLKEGKVTYDAAGYRRWTTLGRQAGLPGPHVIGSAGAGAVRDVVAPGTDLNKGEWPPAVREGVQAVARAAMEATKDLPRWYYYGVDEPTGENTYAIQDYQAWHDGGAHTYATFYVPSFLEKASAYLDAPCFVVGLVSAEKTAREAREACEKTGAEFWWYGTGSYVNPFPQEGFMFHNRYGAGLLFWKCGAKAEATWTFCRPHEDVFNDFDGSRVNSGEPKEQCTAYPHLLKPDDWTTYQGAIPTIAWESLREGVDDYLYLYTLTALIKQAQASNLAGAKAAAADAQATLDGLVASVPWRNPMMPVGFETSSLQRLRRVVADRIVTLQGVLAGQAYNPAAATGQRFSVLVKTRPAPRKASLPVLAVPAAAAAPALDGKLSDAAWQGAAVAGDFVDIGSCQPSRLATSARVMADDQALYVGFDCPEPAMSAVQAKVSEHDGTVWLEDGVEFFVGGSSRTPYAHLIVTSANAVLDEANQDASAWNPKLQTAVSKQAQGWSVELAIPWSELAAAGVKREAVMTLNFGRSRYTGEDPQTHTAWSCTYSGFHQPSRFGVALMQQGAVALTSLSLPEGWGRQKLTLSLANRGTAPAPLEIALRGCGRQALTLAPGATQTVAFPVNLRRSGERRLHLTWGAAGATPEALDLAVSVPEPVVGKSLGGLVEAGQVLELPLELSLSPAEAANYRLVLRTAGTGTADVVLPAQAGLSRQFSLTAAAPVKLQALLVDARGRTAWEGASQSLMVLP